MTSVLYRSLAAAVALTLSACITLPVVPKNAMPEVPAPEVFSIRSPATRYLDCLSAQLAPYRDQKIRVVLGWLPNEMGQQLSELSLPANLRSFVRESFGRITNVFELYDGGDLQGLSGIGLDALPNIGGVSDQVSIPLITGSVIQPHVVINGALHMAQVTKSAELDAEILGLGLGGNVRVFDAAVQLYAVNARTRVVMAPSVTLRVRLYAGEQGASAFQIVSSTYVRGRAGFIQSAPTTYALQLVVDAALATLLRELAAANFNISTVSCEQDVNWKQVGRVADTATGSIRGDEYAITIEGQDGLYCATFRSLVPHQRRRERVRITWRQYRSYSIAIEPGHFDEPSASVLSSPVCLPRELLNPTTNSLEIHLEDAEGHRLGVARQYIR